MRSSTRATVRVRLPMVVLALTLGACTAATAGPGVVDDHSTDTAERTRANAFATADRRYDRIESLKGGASLP